MATRAHAMPTLLNGVAATVGSKAITLRDGEFYRALQRLRDGAGSLLGRETLDEQKATIQKVALEEMVQQEMKSFRYSANGRAEAEKIVKAKKGTEKGNQIQKLLSEFKKSESALIAALARSIETEKFLQMKIETLTPVITDAEVERYYRQYPSKYSVGDLESNRGQIVKDLKFEKMQSALEEWVQSLKEKYKFVSFLGAGSEKRK